MHPSSYTIVYVGPLVAGGTCLQRLTALRELGHQLLPVDTVPAHVESIQRCLTYRVWRKLLGPKDLGNANGQILSAFRQNQVQVLWLDKALTIEAKTLCAVRELQPSAKIIGYSPDDMAGSHNQSKQFLQHLPLYDLFFTTKSYGVAELKAMGCPRVEFVGNAFDPATHRPVAISRQDKERLGGGVGFIGNWEPARPAAFVPLTRNGIPVRVWGSRWERCRRADRNLLLERRPVWGDDYARALCAFDINLGLLSKLNRDLSTTRSVEIPACGGFLLAERTEEHRELFEEDKEVVFFSSGEEMLDKARYYLAHPAERARIAAAGRQRCAKSGYSNQDRLKHMLRRIAELS